MMPSPSVLVGLPAGEGRDRLVGWIRGEGHETVVADDGPDTVRWLRRHVFAAFFLDSEMDAVRGVPVWRTVRPIVGRRMVLMAREWRSDLWFEALRAGVGTVLPLPAQEPTVRAALDAVLPPSARRGGERP
jgi:CheY-like chemotaxis protein